MWLIIIIIHLPNSCKRSTDSFILPSNDQLTSEVDAKDISEMFVNFKRKYDKLTNFTLMQAFHLTLLSD